MEASRAVKLFGTEEPPAPAVELSAGVLQARLEAGNLRYIRIGGREALRAVAFLVRDRDWGTYNAEIEDLAVEQRPEGFTVTYEAVCRDAGQALRYRARIEGRADGGLTFSAEGEPLSDFVTNRTGFVVLHPLDGVAGAPLTVEHTDGSLVESRFPERVDPLCPFQDIRALTHEIAPGLAVTCRMEGDAFEMEDHRNWMDASYKTYVRPLALPWPYTLPESERFTQKVTLTLQGSLPQPAAGTGAGSVEVRLGPPLPHPLPRLGLAAPAEHTEAALEAVELLARARPAFLVARFDARRGDNAGTLRRADTLARAVDAELVLEAVLPCLDAAGAPTADPQVLARDMALVLEAVAAADARPARAAVSPAVDLKCTLPGSVWPPAPDWAELIAAARAAFPGLPVGGGMFSYFTELNRKRPPAGLLDFICHSGSPIVHAGDDLSITETLEALPSIFASVRAFADGRPYWIFPTAISMRDNPYGAAPAENPHNIRQAMNRVDPRERGLLGAAWYAGYLAHAARAGLDAVTLGAVAGPSGIVYTRQPHAQPWFDDGARVLPHYFVLAGYMALAGAKPRATEISRGRDVQALAAEGPEGTTLWLTNLTGEEQRTSLHGVAGEARAQILDEESFEAFCRDPVTGTPSETAADPAAIRLPPYAVAALRFG